MNQVELYCAKYGIDRDVVEQWQRIYEIYRPHLHPNRKSPAQVLEFLQEYYTLRPVQSAYAIEYFRDIAMRDEYLLLQDKKEEDLQVEVFQIEEEGAGQVLYHMQEEEHRQQMEILTQMKQGFVSYDFSPQPVVVGVEHLSGFIMAEGSHLLYDRIIMERGLSEAELENIYLVVDYVETMVKHGKMKRLH